MKTSLSDAARLIGLHPSSLIKTLKELGASFDACWPEIEEDWLITVRRIILQEVDGKPDQKIIEADSLLERKSSEIRMSGNACRIVEKLWRKSFWGDNYVSPESVRKMTGISETDYKKAVKELLERNLIIVHKESGKAISLNTHLKGEIDALVEGLINDI